MKFMFQNHQGFQKIILFGKSDLRPAKNLNLDPKILFNLKT